MHSGIRTINLSTRTRQSVDYCGSNEDVLRCVMPTNVLGTDLRCCCSYPLTGFYRDGYCRTGPGDTGLHTVCARMTEEFLAFSCSRGNDLVTPHSELSRPEGGRPLVPLRDAVVGGVGGWCRAASGPRGDAFVRPRVREPRRIAGACVSVISQTIAAINLHGPKTQCARGSSGTLDRPKHQDSQFGQERSASWPKPCQQVGSSFKLGFHYHSNQNVR